MAFVLSNTLGQDSRIGNIRTHMNDKALVVTYDLMAPEASDSHKVDFVVVDNRGNAILPDSVHGSLGRGVSAGEDRQITWEIYKEFDVVYGSFEPVLVLNESRKHLRGPEYAALSLLMPGLGDFFVAEPGSMIIKPYYKMVFTAGTLALSWLALKNRVEIPELWAPPGYYLSADAPPGEDLLYMPDGYMISPERTDYWWFQKDAEILLGIGIASWVFDILWVTRRGVVNNRVFKSLPGQVALVPAQDGLLLTYRFTF